VVLTLASRILKESDMAKKAKKKAKKKAAKKASKKKAR
jgi:hypothetical protein